MIELLQNARREEITPEGRNNSGIYTMVLEMELIGGMAAICGIHEAYRICILNRDKYYYTYAIDILGTAHAQLTQFQSVAKGDAQEQIDRLFYSLNHMDDKAWLGANYDAMLLSDLYHNMSKKCLIKLISEVYEVDFKTLWRRAEQEIDYTPFWLAGLNND